MFATPRRYARENLSSSPPSPKRLKEDLGGRTRKREMRGGLDSLEVAEGVLAGVRDVEETVEDLC